MKTSSILSIALFSLLPLTVFATATAAPASKTCFETTVGEEIFDMPNASLTPRGSIKGTMNIGEQRNTLSTPPDFVNKSIRFSDKVVHHLKELLGQGSTAAVYALNTIWAIRLNTWMDFLPGYVQGARLCKILGIPTVEIRERVTETGTALDMYPSEYVVIKRLYPDHFDKSITVDEMGSFKKATALHLYQNWNQLDPVGRELAHREMIDFVVTLAPLKTYFDFQPSNIVRTTEGWKFIDPSMASLEIDFADANSLTVPFAVPNSSKLSSNNWLLSDFGITGEARQRIGVLIQAVNNYRRYHPDEVARKVEAARAFLGIP